MQTFEQIRKKMEGTDLILIEYFIEELNKGKLE